MVCSHLIYTLMRSILSILELDLEQTDLIRQEEEDSQVYHRPDQQLQLSTIRTL